MRVSLTVFCVACAVSAGAQQLPEMRCLVSNGQGYAFGSPRQVATGVIGNIDVSSDGKFVAYERMVAFDPLDEVRAKTSKPRMVLTIWNAQNDSSWNVAESSLDNRVQLTFKWTQTNNIGVLISERPVKAGDRSLTEAVIERIQAGSNQRQTAFRYVLDPNGGMVDASPDGKAVLVRGIDGATADEVVDLSTGKRISVGKEKEGGFVMWGADGSLLVARRVADGNRKWLKYDFPSGQLVDVTPPKFEGKDIEPFALRPIKLPDKEGAGSFLAAVATDYINADEAGSNGRPHTPPTKAEKLAQSDPGLRGPVLIDADPSSYSYHISHPAKMLVYGKRGGLFVCPFEPIDVDMLEKAMAARAKAKAMDKAKQVALALIIYSADFDDVMPPNSNWQENVYPYMKNKDLANGFVYSLNGNDAGKITDPANTMLGSVDTPYGRAVAYADGHVKWVPGVNPTYAYLSAFGEERRRPVGAIVTV
ncbi:MAG: hypothetical protein JSS65_11670 [Armatimonadetes bacterium]|nr:hypothetical protein [Armatimonadota bacterium]